MYTCILYAAVSSLFWVFAFAPRGFSPVLGYSTLLKSQHFEIRIRPGNRQTKNHLLNELPLNIYLFTWFGQSWKDHEFYQSSWKVLEFGLGPWIVLDFFIRSWKVLEIHNLVYARLFFPFKIRLFYRRKIWLILGVKEPVKLTGSAKTFLCMNNILFLFFILNSICTSNAIASHTKSFCKVLLRIVV